jgi:hypothetical protein
VDGAASRDLAKCLLLGLDAFVHGQDLGDDVIMDEKHWVSSRLDTCRQAGRWRRIDLQTPDPAGIRD